MFVRPFALTMRLAANMTGGHIAILAILSFVFLFAEMFGTRDRRHRRRPRRVGAARGRHLGARDHRRAGSGVRLHAADGRVHRHGHSRSSLRQLITKGYRNEQQACTQSDGRRVWPSPCVGRTPDRLAQEAGGCSRGVVHLLGAALGLGMIVIGADWASASWPPPPRKASPASRARPRRSPAP